MSEFVKGTKLKLTNGDTITVAGKIGEGGQGTVYKVDYNGKDYALKWYLNRYLKSLKPDYRRFFKNLNQNVIDKSPSSSFLWMKAIAVTDRKQSDGFGYIMDLRPKNFSEFTHFIKAKEHFASTETVIRAAINVVDAFQALHKKGKCYQDLSPGNLFFDKNTGDVLICDNDNASPNKTNLGITGTAGYMAPEVILGTKTPDATTDLFSLSVLLFELFFLSHPLDGANCCKYPCLTPQIEKELYAVHPVFVCSKTDKSNAPVRGTCSNLMNLWPAYPDYLHEAFRNAFSEEALHNGNRRLSERDWKIVLIKLLDDAVKCPKCGEINFASMGSGGRLACSVCKKIAVIPYALQLDNNIIVAGTDKKITDFHLDYGSYETVVSTVVESKKNPGVYGLRNDSPTTWTVDYPGKPSALYENGKAVTLIPGTVIRIGSKEIKVIEI